MPLYGRGVRDGAHGIASAPPEAYRARLIPSSAAAVITIMRPSTSRREAVAHLECWVQWLAMRDPMETAAAMVDRLPRSSVATLEKRQAW
jgi:hypothetical protein